MNNLARHLFTDSEGTEGLAALGGTRTKNPGEWVYGIAGAEAEMPQGQDLEAV